MSRATPKMREFAARLISCETRGDKTSETTAAAAFLILEMLRPQLARLMGNAAFSALLSRALVLAKVEVPWLATVHAKADGSLGVRDGLDAQIGRDEIAEGRVVLLAQLLGLLVAFVGNDLTVRLVREVWPNLSFTDAKSDMPESGEGQT